MKKRINKSAIVTGGSKGIGFVITKKLLNDGFCVLICSRNKKDVDAAVSNLSQFGDILGIVADVSKRSDCKRIVNTAIEKFGNIDVLVNNAGVVGPIGPLEKIGLDKWNNNIQINLIGMMTICALAIPSMKSSKHGKIINLCGGGVGSPNCSPNLSAYYTAKTAIAGFTEVVAEELKDFNIQVNCIAPGGVNTNITQTTLNYGRKNLGEKIYNQTLNQLKDGGVSPDLAANLVSFLSSDESIHITGKLLSAKWDQIELLKNKNLSENKYKLRRIDDTLFYEKKTRK